MKMKRQNQVPVLGEDGRRISREKIAGCVLRETDAEVRLAARRFGVSRSFVIAVALADFFGVDKQDKYW